MERKFDSEKLKDDDESDSDDNMDSGMTIDEQLSDEVVPFFDHLKDCIPLTIPFDVDDYKH